MPQALVVWHYVEVRAAFDDGVFRGVVENNLLEQMRS